MEDSQMIVLLAVAVPVIVFAPFIVIAAARWWKSDGNPATHRSLVALLLSLAVAIGVSVLLGATSGGLQTFDRFGLAKRVALPAVYAILAVVMLFPNVSPVRFRKPLWWTSLFAILAVSTFVEIVVPRQPIELFDMAQSVALIGGLLLASAAGMRAAVWSSRDIAVFVAAIGGVALFSQLANMSVTPFDVVRIPAGFMLIYVGLTIRRNVPAALLSLAAGGVIVTMTVLSVGANTNASIAVISQIVACVGLFVLRVLPRALRAPLLVVALGVAVWAAVQTGIWRIVLGQYLEGWDVTLRHRAYEAATVYNLAAANPWTLLFGGGPGATVDLSMSPDAATLRGSGRNVFAVDDVHLLTSWALMKFGILGVIWLGIFIAAVVRQALRVIAIRDRFSFDFVLLLFVVAAVMTALPAATFLFSNPLMAFCMGVLVAREAAQRSLGSLPITLDATMMATPTASRSSAQGSKTTSR